MSTKITESKKQKHFEQLSAFSKIQSTPYWRHGDYLCIMRIIKKERTVNICQREKENEKMDRSRKNIKRSLENGKKKVKN